MSDTAPQLGEVREFREMQLVAKAIAGSDYLPRGPFDVDGLLETVTIKKVWNGDRWIRQQADA